MERKREKMNRHNDRVQGLRTSVNDLKENKLIIENDLQKRITLEETKASLAEQCLTLQNEVDVSAQGNCTIVLILYSGFLIANLTNFNSSKMRNFHIVSVIA